MEEKGRFMSMFEHIPGDIIILARYLTNILYVTNKVYAIRKDYISPYGNFTTCISEVKFDEVKEYISNIRRDIVSRLSNMSMSDREKILDSEDIRDKFLDKYKKDERELKNDSFFQCS